MRDTEIDGWFMRPSKGTRERKRRAPEERAKSDYDVMIHFTMFREEELRNDGGALEKG